MIKALTLCSLLVLGCGAPQITKSVRTKYCFNWVDEHGGFNSTCRVHPVDCRDLEEMHRVLDYSILSKCSLRIENEVHVRR